MNFDFDNFDKFLIKINKKYNIIYSVTNVRYSKKSL